MERGWERVRERERDFIKKEVATSSKYNNRWHCCNYLGKHDINDIHAAELLLLDSYEKS